MTKPSVAMIGLAVMGANLARNIESRGFECAVYNRTSDVTDAFVKEFAAKKFVPAHTLEELVAKMAAPRQIFIMIKAGPAVDAVIDGLLKLVSPGDIIIDGGNTYYKDTVAREKRCSEKGVHFLGIGISGGEEGALKGPSLMPGGNREAWKIMSPMLDAIAAKVNNEPCTSYIGPDGSGHFVKMVHNGIEYGDMQLIAEAYDLLRNVAGMNSAALSEVFAEWNKGPLSSFLIEITAKVLKRKDDLGSDKFLVDQIRDRAGQKGTGKWTAQLALDLGVAVPTMAAAVDARVLSALYDERQAAAKVFPNAGAAKANVESRTFTQAVHDALYCSKVMSYAQGMAMLSAASSENKWNLKLGEIASLWRGGCIIRAQFLDEIRRAYERDGNLKNLMLDSALRGELEKRVPGLREAIKVAAAAGIPVPAFSASLAYFDAYRAARLPQNLTQAQRDFFGAHTFERLDREGSFHAHWE